MASEELKKLYADAAEKGIFVKEFPSQDGYVAFASSIARLERAGYDRERRKKMGLFDANLYMAGGGGETREEAVERAIEVFEASEKIGQTRRGEV